MTEAEQKDYLRDHLLLYSGYQSNLLSIKKSVEKDLNLLNQQLFESIDEVLFSIHRTMNSKELNQSGQAHYDQSHKLSIFSSFYYSICS